MNPILSYLIPGGSGAAVWPVNRPPAGRGVEGRRHACGAFYRSAGAGGETGCAPGPPSLFICRRSEFFEGGGRGLIRPPSPTPHNLNLSPPRSSHRAAVRDCPEWRRAIKSRHGSEHAGARRSRGVRTSWAQPALPYSLFWSPTHLHSTLCTPLLLAVAGFFLLC